MMPVAASPPSSPPPPTTTSITLKDKLSVVLDVAFSWVITGPLVVLYWRGTFNFISHFAFTSGTSDLPDNHDQSVKKLYRAVIIFFTSVAVKILIDIVKHFVHSGLDDLHEFVIFVTKVSFIYWDALFSVSMWVGGFNLLYALPGLHLYALLPVLVVASLLLIYVRGFESTFAPPLHLNLDDDTVLQPKGYFCMTLENGLLKLLADNVISYMVLHFLVICSWWSLWELENNFIMGKMEIIYKDVEAWDSVILSFVLTLALIPAQRYMSKSRSLENPMFVESMFVGIIGFLASVNFWRGFWSLFDFYFLPNIDLVANLVVSHVVGFTALSLLRVSTSLCFSSTKDPVQPRYISCRYWNYPWTNQAQEDREETSLLSN